MSVVTVHTYICKYIRMYIDMYCTYVCVSVTNLLISCLLQ